MVAEKTWVHRWLPGAAMAALLSVIVASAAAAPAAAAPVAAAPVAAAPVAASPAVAATHSPPAITAHHPPGYQIVSSGFVNAPPSSFDTGSFATCPAGTVVWGGGVEFNGSADFSWNVNTSSPNGTSGWAARVNNTGTTATQFKVDAICADKPAGYQIVSQEVANPAGTQADATATCPSPDVLLGGGTLSTADQTLAVLTSAWPRSSTKYAGYLDNGTASNANLIVYAICGHKPAGYKISSNSASVNAGSALLDGITCAPGTSALDGGAKVPDHAPALQISDSVDDGHFGWAIVVNNTGQSVDEADAYEICAS